MSRRTTTSPPAESLSHSVSGRGQRSGVRGQVDGETGGLRMTELQKHNLVDSSKGKTHDTAQKHQRNDTVTTSRVGGARVGTPGWRVMNPATVALNRRLLALINL